MSKLYYYYYIVGCKHRASEVLLYIGGRGLVSQIIEPVTFARCAFIIALRNIALDGYLDTRRNIKHLRHDVRPDIENPCIEPWIVEHRELDRKRAWASRQSGLRRK